jgi:outer membrane protein OmpA-like peptidoglycan-associated protein
LVINPRRNAFVGGGIVVVLVFVALGIALSRSVTIGSTAVRAENPNVIPTSAVTVSGTPIKAATAGDVRRVGFAGTVIGSPLPSRAVPIPNDAPRAYADLLRTTDKVDFALHFDRGSGMLDQKANVDLGRLLSVLKTDAYRGRKVFVVGFADNTGGPEFSTFLSKKRAQVVAAELSSRGVAVAQTFGFGQIDPIGDNATRTGREKNRRVEIFIAR